MSYSVTIKNDAKFCNGEGIVHTWLVLSAPGKDDVYFGFSPKKGEGYFNVQGTIDENDYLAKRTFSQSKSFNISKQQYEDIKNGITNFSKNIPIYNLTPTNGLNFNCTTAVGYLLKLAGIDFLDGVKSPFGTAGRIDGFATGTCPIDWAGGLSFDEYVANLIGIDTVPITFDFALTFGNNVYDIGLAELFLDGKDYVNELTNSLMDKINSWFDEGNSISDNAELAAGLLNALMEGLPAFKNDINSLLDLIIKNSDTSNLPYDLLNELLGYFHDNILLTAIGVKRLVDGESIPLEMLKTLPLSADALIDIMLKNGSWLDTFSPSLFDAENSTVDPLIIDLDGDGIETISLKGNVFFDHDGNNLAENTGWVSADDGLLVLDKDNSGYIETGDELFGNNTRDGNGISAMNGFEALRKHDSNSDGIINSQDDIWGDLKVWQDKNSNALVDSGELISLDEIQISSIDLNYKTRNITDQNNNTHIQHSAVTWIDGSITQASDVWFSLNRGRSLYNGEIEINDKVTSLPFIKGFGTLPNLYVSMSDDSELMYLVQEYVNNPKLAHASGVIDKILFKWAKVSNVDINSRGVFIDARQLSFLEKITGENFKSNETNSLNPHANAASILKQEYNNFSRYFEAMILAQSKYSQIPSYIDIKIDNQTGLNLDFTRFNSYILNIKDVDLKKALF